MHFDNTVALLLGAVLWGIIHGLTPHGHSWLVLLPFALGGMNSRGMLRIAVIYSLGMILAAAAAGSLLGLVFDYVLRYEVWHHYIQLGIGGLLALIGLVFLFRPLSVHHAIDHICGEECHSGEERVLLRSGTNSAMFMLGVMSMIIPCPTNIWVYTLPAMAPSPLAASLIFTLYAVFTGAAITFVAVAMVRARSLVEKLERRGFQMFIWRLSGVIILAAGLWVCWSALFGEHHDAHDHARITPVVHQVAQATPAPFFR